MRFKLDENFGARTQSNFRETGHDVATVFQESIQGSTDEQLYKICQGEQRCLVTLDLDFANTLRFPPSESKGIVVIRVPRNPTQEILQELVRQFLRMLDVESLENHLWIVESGRVRIHQEE